MEIRYNKEEVEKIYKEVRSLPMSQESYEETPLFSPFQVKMVIAYILTKIADKTEGDSE